MNTTPTNDQRSRGRPPADDGDDHRERLLDAAETRFSKRGYRATSLRRIAESAGVTPAMVHYYFGSKRALLIAVLDRVLQPMMAALADLREDGRHDIGAVFRMMFRAMEEHPTLPRLVTREALLPGGELEGYFAEHYAPRLGGVLPPLVAQAQAAGDIDGDFDAPVLALFLLSLCMFPFIARPIAEPVLGLDYGDEPGAGFAAQAWRVFERGSAP